MRALIVTTTERQDVWASFFLPAVSHQLHPQMVIGGEASQGVELPIEYILDDFPSRRGLVL